MCIHLSRAAELSHNCLAWIYQLPDEQVRNVTIIALSSPADFTALRKLLVGSALRTSLYFLNTGLNTLSANDADATIIEFSVLQRLISWLPENRLQKRWPPLIFPLLRELIITCPEYSQSIPMIIESACTRLKHLRIDLKPGTTVISNEEQTQLTKSLGRLTDLRYLTLMLELDDYAPVLDAVLPPGHTPTSYSLFYHQS
ncbi:hypothetical protein DACRYDRAFT_21597 [Dacryopinax primogenitus]|uniref:Uncharacterized protein n=1 Tax=Dacryopinax primogenitus (strain DJM 731) TaxID=1858805 RepID=M5FZE9_DACPD|nr:uncharacterized protein DACRYDRAFT_21597 [Dacryopinax primogenitus]EJU03416.1 hypothetical protein DACRYDRAFT_21597 [Dacryopinax primogenitus]